MWNFLENVDVSMLCLPARTSADRLAPHLLAKSLEGLSLSVRRLAFLKSNADF